MKKLESSLKNMVVVLTAITVIATGLLAYVNQLTAGPIAEANAKALSDAIAVVVPGFDNNPAEAPETIELDGATYKIYKATKGGEFIGAAVESSANGFGGALSVLVGFDKEGNIIDYSLLSHAETPGLGSKAADWFKKGAKGDITGMNPGQGALVVNKDGGQIDAITASTITTRAFLKAVNNAYAAYSGQNVDGASGATQQVSETVAENATACDAQCEGNEACKQVCDSTACKTVCSDKCDPANCDKADCKKVECPKQDCKIKIRKEQTMNNFKVLMNGIVKENPTFVLLLGMCPTLGTTSSAINGMGMGLATAFVLICSNVVISAIKNLIPDMVRIPAFVVVIASFVTLLQMIMQAYVPALYATLGLFIPLIVVNCILLGRAEAFAAKNGPVPSFFDGLGMGLGFTLALTILGGVREFLGTGKLFDITIMPEQYGMLIFVLAPGAFIALGYLIAIVNKLKKA
mgnify:CR=1 FL=1